jgi:hypothetical protein
MKFLSEIPAGEFSPVLQGFMKKEKDEQNNP